jgi:hypothetical protein
MNMRDAAREQRSGKGECRWKKIKTEKRMQKEQSTLQQRKGNEETLAAAHGAAQWSGTAEGDAGVVIYE